MQDCLCVSFQEADLLEFVTCSSLRIEHDDVLVASDHQETTVWGKAHTVHWVLPVKIEQLETLQLEVAAIIVIYLKNLEDTLVIADHEVLAVG